jgi:Lon protease-like protein
MTAAELLEITRQLEAEALRMVRDSTAPLSGRRDPHWVAAADTATVIRQLAEVLARHEAEKQT